MWLWCSRSSVQALLGAQLLLPKRILDLLHSAALHSVLLVHGVPEDRTVWPKKTKPIASLVTHSFNLFILNVLIVIKTRIMSFHEMWISTKFPKTFYGIKMFLNEFPVCASNALPKMGPSKIHSDSSNISNSEIIIRECVNSTSFSTC